MRAHCTLFTFVNVLLFVGDSCGQLQVSRQEKALVLKKVRRLQGAGGQQQCPDREGVQVFPNPTSCNEFVKCENGTATREVCENGLLFDPLLALTDAIFNYCVYNWKAECEGRPADNTPQSSPDCEYQFGLFPSAPGCETSYTKCEFGVATQMPCEAENVNIPLPLGLAWDPQTHTCNWPDLLIDSQGCDPAERLGGFACPQLRDLEGTFNEQFSPFPRFALNDPSIYVICVSGHPRLQSCGADDIFDLDTLSCVRQLPRFG